MAAKKYTVLLGYNAPPDGERHEPGEEVWLTDAAARPLLVHDAVERITDTHEHEEQTEAAVKLAKDALNPRVPEPEGEDA